MSEIQDSALDTEGLPAEELTPQALGHFLPDEFTLSQDQRNNNDAEQFLRSEKLSFNETSLRSEGVQQRLVTIRKAENPILEASQYLLRALSEIPEHIESTEYVDVLKISLRNEINLFMIVCDDLDISWKKMAIVRYCLCTALDEAAIAKTWGQQSGWSQSNLLNHFEGDNDGGNKFFLLVGRLCMDPKEYVDVLEVLLRILGLGFEGRYSIIEDGDRQLSKIRQRLLTIIQSTKDTTPNTLSPHGLVNRGKIKRDKLIVPTRVSFLLCGILIASFFFWYKYWITLNHRDIERKIISAQRINIEKSGIEKLKLAYLLRNEIAMGLVSVDETSEKSKVTFHGDSLFKTGAISVKNEMNELMNKVAKEVRRVNGNVLIIGHTDSIPISKNGIENNLVLSKLRARSVAEFFTGVGLSEGKIKTQGMGDTHPVSDNSKTEGRAKNRRVEIFVTY